MAMAVNGFNGQVLDIVDDEARIEQLLSECLLEGYVLLEKSCPHPKCSTPLVKKNAETTSGVRGGGKEIEPLLVPSQSFNQPFTPINGVPYCVSCSSHVVTEQSEVDILEKSDALKNKGGVLVAMAESTSTADSTASLLESPDLEVINVEPDEVIDVTYVDEASFPEPANTVTEDTDDYDLVTLEYSVRREIATKVLGAKMLQGYTLLEDPCGKCGMPLMEYKGVVSCQVCPVLAKKAKKKIKAQQKLAAETKRLEQEIEAAKKVKAEQEQKALQLAALADEKRKEEAQRKEMMRQVAIEESQRASAMEAEQARLYADAKAKVQQEANRYQEMQVMDSMKKQQQEAELESIRRARTERIEREYAEATEKRKIEELKIAEEIKRIEQMEQRRKMGIATQFENMSRDVLLAEHRKRLEDKVKLDNEIAKLEEDRVLQRLEERKYADDKRAEEETRMIATLEEEAAAKAKAAEEAIRKAKAALEHVHSARREVIAQTIAMAEEEAVAEAEELIKQDREEYKEPVILPSASEIKRENWETLRIECRSVMTRRLIAGWTLTAEFCKGEECQSYPLVKKDGAKQCCVCGGTGTGTDGAYSEAEDYDVVPTEAELQMMRETGVPDFVEHTGYEITPTNKAASEIEPKFENYEQYQENFEMQREIVTKEICRRMMDGWTLLDSSCAKCVMPLMTDPKGNTNICVLPGCKGFGVVASTPAPIDDVIEPLETATLASTLPTIEEFETKPSTAEEPKQAQFEIVQQIVEGKHEEKKDEEMSSAPTLTETIRQNTIRQASIVSPRGDPPASIKPNAVILVEEEELREVENPILDESVEMDIETSSEIVNSKIELEPEEPQKSAMTAKAISNMFMSSPMGQDLEGVTGLTAITDLVEIFIATNVDEEVSSKTKADVITDVKRRMDALAQAASPRSDGVIHLEGAPSPKAFNFESDSVSKKSKPTPETMMRPRGARPPRTTTPRSRFSPRAKGGVVVVGGPGDFDANSLGGFSRAESVASEAIDTILDKIETAKAKLLRDDISIQEQLQAANLIEKLAQAAVAVKALEKLDM